jgi:hypothetical protein
VIVNGTTAVALEKTALVNALTMVERANVSNKKPLKELNPRWKNNRSILVFDCPACTVRPHCFRVAMGEGGWSCSDGDDPEFPWDDLSLTPSLDGTRNNCEFHGWVKKGWVIW